VSKAAVNRMASDMAHELCSYHVAVVSLCPFMVATEMLMARRKSRQLQPWMATPLFVGRAIVALATDPHTMQKSGHVLMTRALAAEYGFTDVDGHQPKWSEEIQSSSPDA
jgi:dehydrogenase/reductase SDR family member 1